MKTNTHSRAQNHKKLKFTKKISERLKFITSIKVESVKPIKNLHLSLRFMSHLQIDIKYRMWSKDWNINNLVGLRRILIKLNRLLAKMVVHTPQSVFRTDTVSPIKKLMHLMLSSCQTRLRWIGRIGLLGSRTLMMDLARIMGGIFRNFLILVRLSMIWWQPMKTTKIDKFQMVFIKKHKIKKLMIITMRSNNGNLK